MIDIGEIAQQVEQRPEKPCVPSSILGFATIYQGRDSVPFFIYDNT